MTPMYYYMWEFFTSITIIILVIAYIVYDQIQERKEKENALRAEKVPGNEKSIPPAENAASGQTPGHS